MFLPDGNVVGAEKSHVLETLLQGGTEENKEKLEVLFSHARTTRKKQKQRAPSSLPTRFTRTRRAIVSVGTPVCNLSTLIGLRRIFDIRSASVECGIIDIRNTYDLMTDL